LWLHSLKVAQLLRSAACLHTNQSRSYLNHLVSIYMGTSRKTREIYLFYKSTILSLGSTQLPSRWVLGFFPGGLAARAWCTHLHPAAIWIKSRIIPLHAWVCGRLLVGIAVSNPGGCMDVVFCECCVLSGRGLCDGLITQPKETYRVLCVWLWILKPR